MASIRREIEIDVPPSQAWDALRDFGAVHERLAPGFLLDARLQGDSRIVTFFNGASARELLVSCDERERRLVWSVAESGIGLTHHNASAQVFALDGDRTRFVWIADLLPDAAAATVAALIERGLGVIKRTLEAAGARPADDVLSV
jgi:hypothetical protein